MNRSILFVLLLVPSLGFAISACEFGNRLSNWEKDQLEGRVGDDLETFVDQFGDYSGNLDEAAAERSEARYLWEDCIVGYAGCQRCYVMEGDSTGGTLSMEHVLGDEVESCTASLTLNDVYYGFTIDEWWWDGSWATRTDGLYDVEWNGVQTATLVIEGSERNDGTYDYEYTMNAATGVTDGDGDVSEWAVDYDYVGYLDHDWHVVAAKDAEGNITGTITGSAANCVISGSDYDYVVDCE
jgi:hypothetical protein